MAIEYGGGSQGMSPEPEGSMESNDNPTEEKSEGETAEIPMSMVRDGQPGDVVRLTIVSRNDDSGTATVKYAEEMKMGSSIKEAASKFEE